MLQSVLAAALVFTQQDASLAYRTAAELVQSFTPRDAGTVRSQRAAVFLLEEASKAGANVRRDVFKAAAPGGVRRFVNLYADFVCNPTGSWVVVMSHYDTKPGVECPGANDGASTSGLLVGLANALASWHERRGNVMLVWTDAEECRNAYAADDGFQGSRRAVEYVKEQNRAVKAAICLDMIGDRDLHVSIPSNVSEGLACVAERAARAAGFPKLVSRAREIVKDDHVAFLEAGHGAIDLIDFSYGPDNAWWHSPEDTMDKISEKSLLKSGKLVAEMLNILL